MYAKPLSSRIRELAAAVVDENFKERRMEREKEGDSMYGIVTVLFDVCNLLYHNDRAKTDDAPNSFK